MEEQLQTISSLTAGALTAIGIYLTIVSGYLIVAYLAGSKLSRSQVVVVSMLFVLFSLYLSLTSFNFINSTYLYSASVGLVSDPFGAWIMLVLLISGIITSLWFTINVRRKGK